MQRDDITKIFPDATEEQKTALLNMLHGEVNAAKRELDQFVKRAEAAERAVAETAGQLSDMQRLQEQIGVLNSRLAEADKRNNITSAVAALVKAGMNEALATSIAATAATEDADASNATISAIVAAYTAQEQAKAAEAAKQSLQAMPTPASGTAGDTAVELAKKLAEGKSAVKTSGVLDEFRKK